jgi:hypothetical protein
MGMLAVLMKDLFRSAFQWLAETRLARGMLDTVFRGKARQRLVELDSQSVGRSQNRTLLGLVNKAQATRFGRDHDFRRIRNIGDFRRLVPLRTPAELWREYWQPVYPRLSGATWPGAVSYLAISAATPNGPFPYVPVTPELWAAQQTAAMTALAFVMHASPRTRLCSGQMLLLGGTANLVPLNDGAGGESLEALAVRELPATLRCYASAYPEDRTLDKDRLMLDVALRAARTPVTCLAGTAGRLARFFDHIRNITGRETITDVWPRLSAVLYAAVPGEPEPAEFLSTLRDTGVVLLETCLQPEGAIALEDPRHGCLRLLPDLGVYFEFVPVDQIGKPRPERVSAAEAKLGVPYALAISSPAGVWACLIGNVVEFVKRDPPLLRLVETGRCWQPQLSAPAAPRVMPYKPAAQGPHARSRSLQTASTFGQR